MDAAVINYLPKRRDWIRRHWRLVTLLATLLLVAIGVGRYGHHAIHFAQQIYWQRQCMNFRAPPETVVYEQLPAGSIKPIISFPYTDGEGAEVSALRPGIMGVAIPDKVYRVPECWVRFLQVTRNRNSGDVPTAVLFCHERISHSGLRRLVTVEFSLNLGVGDHLDQYAISSIFTPVNWRGSAITHKPQEEAIFSDASYLPMPNRIFAGQPDPADASHFTIGYEWPGGLRGTLDGWLRDSNQVDIQFRPGPGDLDSARKVLPTSPFVLKTDDPY